MGPSTGRLKQDTGQFFETKDLHLFLDQGPMPSIDLEHKVDGPSEFYRSYR